MTLSTSPVSSGSSALVGSSKKEDVGPQRQRAGDGDALLLSAGELAGVGVRLVRKAHLFEQGERQLTHLAALALCTMSGASVTFLSTV